LPTLPLSSRLIKEVHQELMTEARSSHDAKPGAFRTDKTWIDGTSPFDARFVPPPASEIARSTSDLENFLHRAKEIPALIKAGLAHAQFETIHPFRDGNGRMGRLLITFYLCEQNVLERPVLYLSEFLKQHRKTYFERLDRYRDGGVYDWLEFFLRGIVEVAGEAVVVSDKIVKLRERDMEKVAAFGRKTSGGALLLLKELYKSPIVNARRVQEATGFSRQGAYNLIERFVAAKILYPRGSKEYGQTYAYKDYLKLFEKET